MKRSWVGKVLCCAALLLGFAGCGSAKEQVTLSVWGSENDQALLVNMAESFKEKYKNEAEFNITVSEESEMTCKETVLANPQAAADVYIFAGDQFDSLCKNQALHEITVDKEAVISANGGADSAAIAASSMEGKLYACPMTASNGYFLYYNSEYLTKEDVKSFDRILDVAEQNGKKVAMDLGSGWYLYSFFKGAGLNVESSEDGKSNSCDWNTVTGTYKGTDVAEAVSSIASREGFLNCGDEVFVAGVEDGTVIAGVNGTWNAPKVQQAFGAYYAAAKLPAYTLAGEAVQMHSFAGYKLVGVNAYTKQEVWAQRFAEWITNEENQMERFRQTGEGPSNVNAAASAEVQAAPAIAALAEQAKYAHIQRVSDSYWMPTKVFGTTIAAGNLDEMSMQELLDRMVEGITSTQEETE